MSKISRYKIFSVFLKKEFNKNLLVFALFYIVASLLWAINALEKTYTVSIPVTIHYQEIPKTKALLVSIPQQIKVDVKASGFSLLHFYLTFNHSQVNINVRELCDIASLKTKEFKIPTITNKNIKQLFSNSITITSVNPDTIYFKFAEVTSKKVAIKPVVDIEFVQQFQLQKKIYVSPDSIVIFGAEQLLQNIDSICTLPISMKNVSKSFSQTIGFKKINNIQFTDSVGTVYVMVEKFTEQQYSVPIKPIHVPDSLLIDLMQDKALITIFIGLSQLEKIDASMFKVVADYSKQDKKTGEIPVTIIEKPTIGRVISQTPEKVGYIIDVK